MKPVQHSPAMVSFSSDKINILQHIKCFFSANVLAPGALDGMNTICEIDLSYGLVASSDGSDGNLYLENHVYHFERG